MTESETESEVEITDDQRREAYRKAQRASRLLDEAAQKLGYTNVHELANAASGGDLPDEIDGGVKAVTNAHSYLNNGSLEGSTTGLHPDT